MSAWNLPFDEIWSIDFEFVADPGERQVPVCLVAREMKSGRLVRVWHDEFKDGPPFRTDDGVLFVAYFSSAEVECFLALDWPVPRMWIDLFAEFKRETNNLPLAHGRGLLGAMRYHGLAGISKEEKQSFRERIMAGFPFYPNEVEPILDYCQTDVDPLPALLDRMLPEIQAGEHGLAHALIRGRYMIAVARMRFTGTPIDVPMLEAMRSGWDQIKADQVEAVNARYGVYEGMTFKHWRMVEYLNERDMAWPKLDSGRLKLDDDTFRDMVTLYPEMHHLRDTRRMLSNLKELKLPVGSDGRNRVLLSPFGTVTGRNAPSTNEFVFGLPSWLRSLIRPSPGRGLAYVDWSAQEVWIAAVLSGDGGLLEAVQSGDPYLAFAKMAKIVPPDATKRSHPRERAVCKIAVLGTNYGMQAESLAMQTGLSIVEAGDMLRRLQLVFPRYFRWRDDQADGGHLELSVETLFGWRAHVLEDTKTNTLRNFPMQANGAEMLRLGCSLVTEAGIDVCAPVHDAVLVEAALEDLDDVVATTRRLMAEASSVVLDGLEVATDVDLVRFPDRYVDGRDHDDAGEGMWHRVTASLGVDEVVVA